MNTIVNTSTYVVAVDFFSKFVRLSTAVYHRPVYRTPPKILKMSPVKHPILKLGVFSVLNNLLKRRDIPKRQQAIGEYKW